MSPSRTQVRTRLAVGITLSTVVITLLVGVVTAALALWRADDPNATAKVGAAQVNGETVLVVAETQAPEGLLQRAWDARRTGATVLALDTGDQELESVAHESLIVPGTPSTSTEPSATPSRASFASLSELNRDRAATFTGNEA